VDCATYDEDGQRKDCDCGIPDLLRDLLMLIEPDGDRLLERGALPQRAP
jgi:hypothetical protein